MDVLDRLCPITKIMSNNYHRKFISQETRALMAERNREFKTWEEMRDQQHHVQYKALRNHVTNSLRMDVMKSEQKCADSIA